MDFQQATVEQRCAWLLMYMAGSLPLYVTGIWR